MPWFIKDTAKRYRLELRALPESVTLKMLAADAEVPWKPMCNALLGLEPLNEDRVSRIVAAIAVHTNRTYSDVHRELVWDGHGVPNTPPHQPTQPTGPDPRRDGRQSPAPSRGRPERDNRSPRRSKAVA
jgi:hypothetical protein